MDRIMDAIAAIMNGPEWQQFLLCLSMGIAITGPANYFASRAPGYIRSIGGATPDKLGPPSPNLPLADLFGDKEPISAVLSEVHEPEPTIHNVINFTMNGSRLVTKDDVDLVKTATLPSSDTMMDPMTISVFFCVTLCAVIMITYSKLSAPKRTVLRSQPEIIVEKTLAEGSTTNLQHNDSEKMFRLREQAYELSQEKAQTDAVLLEAIKYATCKRTENVALNLQKAKQAVVVEQLNVEVGRLEAQVQLSAGQKEEVAKIGSQLEAKNAEIGVLGTALRTTHRDAHEQKSQHAQQTTELQARNRQLKDNLKQMRQDVQSKEEEIETLKNTDKKEMADLEKQLTEEKLARELERKEFQIAVNDKEASIQTEKGHSGQLREQVTKLERERKAQEQQHAKRLQQKDDQIREMEAGKKQQLKALTSDYEAQLVQKDAELKQFEDLEGNLNNQLDDITNQKVEELDVLHAQIEQNEKESDRRLADQDKKYNEINAKHVRTVEKLNAEKNAVQERDSLLVSKDDDLNTLQSNLAETKSRLEDLTATEKSLRAHSLRQAEDLQQKKQDLAKLTTQHKALETEHQEQIEEHRAQLNSKDDGIASLWNSREKQISTLKNEHLQELQELKAKNVLHCQDVEQKLREEFGKHIGDVADEQWRKAEDEKRWKEDLEIRRRGEVTKIKHECDAKVTQLQRDIAASEQEVKELKSELEETKRVATQDPGLSVGTQTDGAEVDAEEGCELTLVEELNDTDRAEVDQDTSPADHPTTVESDHDNSSAEDKSEEVQEAIETETNDEDAQAPQTPDETETEVDEGHQPAHNVAEDTLADKKLQQSQQSTPTGPRGQDDDPSTPSHQGTADSPPSKQPEWNRHEIVCQFCTCLFARTDLNSHPRWLANHVKACRKKHNGVKVPEEPVPLSGLVRDDDARWRMGVAVPCSEIADVVNASGRWTLPKEGASGASKMGESWATISHVNDPGNGSPLTRSSSSGRQQEEVEHNDNGIATPDSIQTPKKKKTRRGNRGKGAAERRKQKKQEHRLQQQTPQ